MTLASGERAFFDEHGWVVVRDVIDRARVTELAAALDAVVPEWSYAHG